MKNKSGLLLLLLLAAALLLAKADAAWAQQPAKDQPLAEPVYVVGYVVVPQAVIFSTSITISQAIGLAGGVRHGGGLERVRVYRYHAADKTRTVMIVDLKALEKGRAVDVTLRPFDIVEVVGRRLSKHLKKECPDTLCAQVEPLPAQKYFPLSFSH
jgi:hypothetical protein